jgi:multiple sugar transport system permease protein
MRAEAKDYILLLLPAMTIIFFLEIFPLIFAVRYTFSETNLVRPYLDRPFIGLENFSKILSDSAFWNSLEITFVYVIIACIAEFPFGLVLSLLIHRGFRGKGFFWSLLTLPMVATPIAAAYIWMVMYNPTFGLLNYFLSLVGISPIAWLGSTSTSLLCIIIIDIWQWTPFIALICFAGLENLPAAPFEAATVDGASSLQVFRNLTLPMLRKILGLAILFRLLWLFKDFDKVLLLTGGGPGSSTDLLGMYIYKTSFRMFNMGYSMALGWIMLFIVMFIARLILRSFWGKEEI